MRYPTSAPVATTATMMSQHQRPETAHRVQRTLKLLRVQKALRGLRNLQAQRDRSKAHRVKTVIQALQEQEAVTAADDPTWKDGDEARP